MTIAYIDVAKAPVETFPQQMFYGGVQGFVMEVDPAVLFADTAGTIPITPGSPVALWRDKSGRGNHLIQTALANRPIYQTNGVLHWLVFDGSNSFMVSSTINFAGTDKISLFAAFRRVGTSVGILLELGATSNSGSTFGLMAPSSGNTLSVINHGPGVTTYETFGFSDVAAPTTGVFSALLDRAKPAANEIVLRKNGLAVGASTRADNTTGNFEAAPVYVGRRGGTTAAFSGNLYGLIVRGAATAESDIRAAEQRLASASGVSL